LLLPGSWQVLAYHGGVSALLNRLLNPHAEFQPWLGFGALGGTIARLHEFCRQPRKIRTKYRTEATEGTGSEVPTMKQADASDCMDQPETKSN
jgi:hypothetical protein